MSMVCHFILYVRDQQTSSAFYKAVLKQEPALDVPGMTEFRLSEKCILGLMPEKGIKRILQSTIIDPETTNGISRAEVYFLVRAPEEYRDRALASGGKLLSDIEKRGWGHRACYLSDLDGHVIAFATEK